MPWLQKGELKSVSDIGKIWARRQQLPVICVKWVAACQPAGACGRYRVLPAGRRPSQPDFAMCPEVLTEIKAAFRLSVLASMPREKCMFQHILVPSDGSPLSAKAIKNALSLAKSLKARVTVLTITEPYHVFSKDPLQLADTEAAYKKRSQAEASRILAEADEVAQRAGVAYATLQLEHEQVHQAIIETASKRGCDLIAMASHGRRGFSALVLGSVTTKVLTHSSLPVLVYR
jgi:nucleotide-binding universal stress UspA family protein